jgi:cob(I)alamin adenosyltransferase
MTNKIYTRKGDKGNTRLADGRLVSKGSLRVEVYGTIDEANAWIGTAGVYVKNSAVLLSVLNYLSHKFYNCSSILALSEKNDEYGVYITDADVTFLERAIDRLNEETGPLSGFVLCGGSEGASFLQIARTVVRRAERLLCRLNDEERVNPVLMKFMNRSSDLLFAAARYANLKDNAADLYWDKEFPIPDI